MGDVGSLADFRVEVVEARFLDVGVGLGFPPHGFDLGNEGEFPWPLAHGLELVTVKIILGVPRGGLGLAEEQW